ncbi:hypothetical protein SAMN04488020_102434 [Palleronia marisminoris]|uniref:DUF4760 domain-containing protein n=1 Tax=Palleronia marisminoris TaxID=315423 RepID=A0A1Y5RW12_9RHOB|nr:hypothetical protein [Palleronia marisminoris]SFG51887.1 hypothetical protein SAMN04488020_102434 [Palleronia marisminoris]SLN24157.1 hypothetical protein PAM7066_00847 [Palleronia marisminoris]
MEPGPLGIDPRIWQAIVAGAFLALGWIVNGWQNRREAARRRHERLRDSHRALYAEIGTNLDALGGPDVLEAHETTMVARMESEPDFVPFVPSERPMPVFEGLVEHVHILPRVTIDPIVAYYSQMQAVTALVQDMRGPAFASLSAERRIAIYRDYIGMKTQAFLYGDYALHLIASFAEGGKSAAEKTAARLSSRDADPSGR